jgi:hypothetical protein
METGMFKSLITVVAALAVVGLGWFVSSAQAGNGAQGISKYQRQAHSQTAITEFSSSSAPPNRGPRR